MQQSQGDREGTRLETLRRSLLMDSPSEPSFDRITGLVAELLRVPVALVSLIEGSRQFFKSSTGLPEAYQRARETPLTHSFCQYVVADQAPLVISDAREDDRLRTNLAIPDLGVIAYAGVPVRLEGATLGSLCAIDRVPRSWSDRDLGLLTTLGSLVEDLIVLRLGSLARARAQQEVNEELRAWPRSTAACSGPSCPGPRRRPCTASRCRPPTGPGRATCSSATSPTSGRGPGAPSTS